MFGWLKYIRLVRRVDELCFGKEKKAGIKFTLFGEPGYDPDARILGFSAGKRYLVPIFTASVFFWRYPSLLRIAIHEVRHRIQWERAVARYSLNDIPKLIREIPLGGFDPGGLYSLEDVPEAMHSEIVVDIFRRGQMITPREIDAEIVERLALPLFGTNQTAFLEVMFGKA